MAGWMTDSENFERLLCCLKSYSEEFCWTVADTWLAFYFLKRVLLSVTETYTCTRRRTHGLIAVPCLSLWLALWKGHLTKPLTGWCNTCVCSELSDTKKTFMGIAMTGEALWHLTDRLTGLRAGWQIKADTDTDTSEKAMKKKRRDTNHARESEEGFTWSKNLLNSTLEFVSIISTHCIDTLAPKFFKSIKKGPRFYTVWVKFKHTKFAVNGSLSVGASFWFFTKEWIFIMSKCSTQV